MSLIPEAIHLSLRNLGVQGWWEWVIAREAKREGRQANRCPLFCSNYTYRRQVRRRKTRPSIMCGLIPPPQQEIGLKCRQGEDYKTKKNKNNRIRKDQKSKLCSLWVSKSIVYAYCLILAWDFCRIHSGTNTTSQVRLSSCVQDTANSLCIGAFVPGVPSVWSAPAASESSSLTLSSFRGNAVQVS